MLGLAHHCAIYSIGRQCNKAAQSVMGNIHKKEEMEETATRKRTWRRQQQGRGDGGDGNMRNLLVLRPHK